MTIQEFINREYKSERLENYYEAMTQEATGEALVDKFDYSHWGESCCPYGEYKEYEMTLKRTGEKTIENEDCLKEMLEDKFDKAQEFFIDKLIDILIEEKRQNIKTNKAWANFNKRELNEDEQDWIDYVNCYIEKLNKLKNKQTTYEELKKQYEYDGGNWLIEDFYGVFHRLIGDVCMAVSLTGKEYEDKYIKIKPIKESYVSFKEYCICMCWGRDEEKERKFKDFLRSYKED